MLDWELLTGCRQEFFLSFVSAGETFFKASIQKLWPLLSLLMSSNSGLLGADTLSFSTSDHESCGVRGVEGEHEPLEFTLPRLGFVARCSPLKIGNLGLGALNCVVAADLGATFAVTLGVVLGVAVRSLGQRVVEYIKPGESSHLLRLRDNGV
mmetsp:Transcript_21733/g.34339  ORF Transcript_21733/g.34339 Transcript_21733/m.34339 type:complete len:153 (+) Transcript_21733:1358-1816(+)